MRILLTNDDGIRAPGIVAMFDALLDAHGTLGGPLRAGNSTQFLEVFTIAPLTVQSATSHGVTFHEPLMVSSVEVNERMSGVAVDGRPADCVKLAVSALWPERFGQGARPDLIISGMNNGANCGINVIYSGTVAAAIEGAFLGIPSIAISMLRGGCSPRFDLAAARARKVLDRLLARGLPGSHECISINIPLTEEPRDDAARSGGPRPQVGPGHESFLQRVGLHEMPEVVVCPMNVHGLVDKYERRVSPSGDVYYWAAGHGLDFHATETGTDVDVLKQGRITVTPLTYDLTRRDAIESLAQRLRP
ncbi:MAG: 5'/3'-nucleotidase SurE [Planctomycetota bacterium]|nr:5'/3'-nucleotidase SurE [Planctomycetota bacterium]